MTVAVTVLDAENSVSNWLSPCSPAPAHTEAHASVMAAAMQVRVHVAGVPSSEAGGEKWHVILFPLEGGYAAASAPLGDVPAGRNSRVFRHGPPAA
jgi:hypothetical protein